MKTEETKLTLTFHNDLAFTKHQEIARLLKIIRFCTRPYTSQDKGTVENKIGVINRSLIKGLI